MDVLEGDWRAIVGKAVDSVVTVTNAEAGAFAKVRLVFTDGSTFEIYTVGGSLNGSSRIYRGNLAEVLSYEHHEAVG